MRREKRPKPCAAKRLGLNLAGRLVLEQIILPQPLALSLFASLCNISLFVQPLRSSGGFTRLLLRMTNNTPPTEPLLFRRSPAYTASETPTCRFGSAEARFRESAGGKPVSLCSLCEL